MRKYLVIGVDPGTTTGLGILDLEGEVLRIDSWRDLSLSDLVEEIVEEGNPIMVSTDVEPAPNSVKQLSTMLDARLWKPEKSLSKEEKRRITDEYETKNKHESDALAAVLKSYWDIESKIKNIRNRSPDELENRELIKLVIQGKSLKEAVEELRSEREKKESIEDKERNKKVEGLEKKIQSLQEKIKDLRDKNRRKSEEIRELKKEISKVKSKSFLSAIKSSEVKSREKKLESLKKELSEKDERLEELSKLVSVSDRIESYKEREESLVLKKLSSFTKDKIDELKNTLGIEKGDILFIEDASGGGSGTAEKLINKVRALVVKNQLSHPAKKKLIKEEIPYIESSKIDFNDFNDFVVTDKKKLEDLIKEKKTEINKIKKERFKEKLEDLEGF